MKIYKDTELPHLKIPTALRQYLRQKGESIGIEFKEAKYKVIGSNYIHSTKIITIAQINKIDKEYIGVNRIYSKKDKIHNAKCFLFDNLNELIEPKDRKELSLVEQSLKMGRTRTYLSVMKHSDSVKYRLLRMIGKGNFILAQELYEDEMMKMSRDLYIEVDKFKSESDLARYIKDKYNNKYKHTESILYTINSILCSTSFSIRTYRRAKEIKKIMNNIDFDKMDKCDNNLYVYS